MTTPPARPLAHTVNKYSIVSNIPDSNFANFWILKSHFQFIKCQPNPPKPPFVQILKEVKHTSKGHFKILRFLASWPPIRPAKKWIMQTFSEFFFKKNPNIKDLKGNFARHLHKHRVVLRQKTSIYWNDWSCFGQNETHMCVSVQYLCRYDTNNQSLMVSFT